METVTMEFLRAVNSPILARSCRPLSLCAGARPTAKNYLLTRTAGSLSMKLVLVIEDVFDPI
jgi:hypothetical protein